MRLATTRQLYAVDRARISYLKFILEAYDNLAVVSTIDACRGVVQVVTAPGCEAVVQTILSGLGDECGLRVIADEVGSCPDALELKSDTLKPRTDS